MRNLNAICAIANLRWMNFKCLLLINTNSGFTVIKSEFYKFKIMNLSTTRNSTQIKIEIAE